MLTEIEHLEGELKRDFPQSEPKLKILPSGAAILDFKVGSEMYVLEYHSDVGWGLNKMDRAVFGWEGYEHPFDDFPSARRFLLKLLSDK